MYEERDSFDKAASLIGCFLFNERIQLINNNENQILIFK